MRTRCTHDCVSSFHISELQTKQILSVSREHLRMYIYVFNVSRKTLGLNRYTYQICMEVVVISSTHDSFIDTHEKNCSVAFYCLRKKSSLSPYTLRKSDVTLGYTTFRHTSTYHQFFLSRDISMAQFRCAKLVPTPQAFNSHFIFKEHVNDKPMGMNSH